ncbi:MAG: DUF4388 domain-containing protein [Candidatus Dormibacteraeota bacterium]|uniref:DUF4388 domain-containing protein n=1 Tax=Candidatus Amunia macphersoniae TaxID=3127014 RepID=A0A934KEF6_9BACT|nr:DUF4388 domain-containing protein [Candidatus Dormibacteraeota bacterium]
MQTQGSLQESDLASLLQTMQSERATGTLTLEGDADSAALFFLFGHLFHASGGGGEGEGVVVKALGWRDGTFHFDPRAKLPAEETIKSSPAELIAAAEDAGDSSRPDDDQAHADTAPALRAIDSRRSSFDSDTSAAEDTSIWSPAASVPKTAEPGPQVSWSAPAYTPSEYSPTYVPAEPAPLAEVAAPSGEDSSGPAPVTAGAATTAQVGSLPIPAGKVQYEGLKSAFVDFPRLLRTLRTERHTGYIRLVSGDDTGVLLFREGELIEAEAGEHGSAHGEEAFITFRRQMDTGVGLIDVIDLDSETVSAVARLLTGPPHFTGLLARFVNFSALLEYLAEEGKDGSVIVVGGSQTGVILLEKGGILAAYTAGSRQPEKATEQVASLAEERPARIEVRGDDSSRAGIDVEAALSRPY